MVSFLLKPRGPYTFVEHMVSALRRESKKKCKSAGIFLGVIGVPPTNFTLKSIICEHTDASQERNGPAFHKDLRLCWVSM